MVIAQRLSDICPNVFAVNGPDRSVPDSVDDSLVLAVSVSE